MNKNIKDMSFAEIENELLKCRNRDEKLEEIKNLVLSLKKTEIENIEHKISQICYYIDELIIDKENIEQIQLELNVSPKKQILNLRRQSKTSKIKSAIVELLEKEELTTNQIHQKLAEKGIVASFGSIQGQNDYNITRATVGSLKNDDKKIIQTSPGKRGSTWKLVEGHNLV